MPNLLDGVPLEFAAIILTLLVFFRPGADRTRFRVSLSFCGTAFNVQWEW